MLFEYINTSFSIRELKENILKRKTFRKGFSVNDLVSLNGVKNRQDLFSKFEDGIKAVIDLIDKEKFEPDFTKSLF